jgi:superoxide dismutase, Cu-Zn family
MKTILSMAALLAISGCALMSSTKETVAEATVAPTQGNTAAGKVRFTQKGDFVKVEIELAGLTPGAHGFHIHEKGDCSAPDGMSAGGHFNPSKSVHGASDAPVRHAGDLGNVVAGADGKVTAVVETSGMSVGTGDNGIVGRAVIVHASPDDLKTQPTGNAGKRVGCGVIGAKS